MCPLLTLRVKCEDERIWALLISEILAFSNVTLATALEATEVFQPSPKMKRRPTNVNSSVLQRLLVERNRLFWDHLNTFLQTTVVTASSQTLATEQLLVQSQVKLQAASRTIKHANEMADQVLGKCKDILTSNFLPDVTIRWIKCDWFYSYHGRSLSFAFSIYFGRYIVYNLTLKIVKFMH